MFFFAVFLSNVETELFVRTQRTLDFTVDEGKEWLNPARDTNLGKHRRSKAKEEKSNMKNSVWPVVLRDPGCTAR